MDFEMDHVMLRKVDGKDQRIFCKDLGIHWPPPEKLSINGVLYTCIRRSELSDELMVKLSKHVARGAEYREVDS